MKAKHSHSVDSFDVAVTASRLFVWTVIIALLSIGLFACNFEELAGVDIATAELSSDDGTRTVYVVNRYAPPSSGCVWHGEAVGFEIYEKSGLPEQGDALLFAEQGAANVGAFEFGASSDELVLYVSSDEYDAADRVRKVVDLRTGAARTEPDARSAPDLYSGIP